MLKKRIEELLELEEDRFLAGSHQQVQKERQKAWHDKHIKKKEFQPGEMVLMYDNKFLQHPGKLHMY